MLIFKRKATKQELKDSCTIARPCKRFMSLTLPLSVMKAISNAR